jgi:hypothetical protein
MSSVRESIQRATTKQERSNAHPSPQRASEQKHTASDTAANAANTARKIGLIRQGLATSHATIDAAARVARDRITLLARRP